MCRWETGLILCHIRIFLREFRVLTRVYFVCASCSPMLTQWLTQVLWHFGARGWAFATLVIQNLKIKGTR